MKTIFVIMMLLAIFYYIFNSFKGAKMGLSILDDRLFDFMMSIGMILTVILSFLSLYFFISVF